MMTRQHCCNFCALALLLFTTGCSKEPLKPVEVKGHVLNTDGKPLANAKLEFIPFPFEDLKPGMICPVALTNHNGEFTIPVENATNAISPRRYKVTVSGALPKYANISPKLYQDPLSTPIDVTIPKQGQDNLVIELK